jgi:hypothetical protein
MNNGQCKDEGNTCQCPAGFFGIHCQNNERWGATQCSWM